MGPHLANGHPILRMPFPAGTVVLCQQGNLSPPNRTHFKSNNRHALDFSNTSAPLLAVSAAPGRVAFVFAGSDRTDKHAGRGYGNQVKVDHGGSYFTLYAHLDEVLVREGESIESAVPIGTVGCTGAAGNRHLHFSLHQGSTLGLGVLESTSMDALITAEATERPEFGATSSEALRDGQSVLWNGALYGSENAPDAKALAGIAPAALAARLDAGRRELQACLEHRKALDTLAWGFESHDVAWARSLVTPALERTRGHAVARYWLATAVDAPEGRVAQAEATYEDLLKTGHGEPSWETWLVSWCHNRLGVIDRARGAYRDAREHFRVALETATAEPERSFASAELARFDEGPDAAPR